MHRNRTDLKNIGPKMAGRLNGAALFTECDLRAVGAMAAYPKSSGAIPVKPCRRSPIPSQTSSRTAISGKQLNRTGYRAPPTPREMNMV